MFEWAGGQQQCHIRIERNWTIVLWKIGQKTRLTLEVIFFVIFELGLLENAVYYPSISLNLQVAVLHAAKCVV